MDVEKIKALIAEREAIDADITALVNGESKRAAKKCSKCGQEGHTARTCTVELPQLPA